MVENASKKRILIMDDDEFILDMYVMKFRGSGFDVETAKSGEEAIEKIQASTPDAVLLDVAVPNMDGFEVLNKSKKEKLSPKSKYVILSNLGEKSDIDKGLKLGADDYIVKAHHTPTEVVDKVKKLLKV